MAKKKSSKNQTKLISFIAGVIVIILVVLFGGANVSDIFGDIGLSGNHGTQSGPSGTLISDSSALSMHVLNVGQADCILLSKGGVYALVDCGESSEPSERESREAIYRYLDDLGVKKLDFLLVTHQDYDHIGSAKDILSRYSVGTFYDNGFTHTSATYEKLMTYIDENNIRYKVVYAGDSIKSPWSGVTIRVLSPPEGYIDKDVNHNSIVLKITYGDVSYLLTGDATTQTEEYILSSGVNVDADVLKVGHHGSYSSSSEAFLKAVSPGVSIISCGADNEYGHPHSDALKRLAKFTNYLYRTDIDGTILVSTDGKEYSVVTENGTAYDKVKEFVTGDGKKISV